LCSHQIGGRLSEVDTGAVLDNESLRVMLSRGSEPNHAKKAKEEIMAEIIVKRIKDMNDQELAKLPQLKATLRRVEFNRSGQVNHTLKVEIMKDFDYEVRLTQEQYALIKVMRNLKYDTTQIMVSGRISKGLNKDGTHYYLIDIVPVPGMRFGELLSNDRVRFVEMLVSRGQWPKHLPINTYPQTENVFAELSFNKDEK